MSSNGPRTVSTPITTARRQTARRGWRQTGASAPIVSCAAVPGAALQVTSAPRTASGPSPALGTTASASASAGRLLRPDFLPPYLMGLERSRRDHGHAERAL